MPELILPENADPITLEPTQPETFTCSICGTTHPLSELYEMDESLLCPACLTAHTVVCHHCGRRIWRDDDAGDDDTPLCESCHDNYYLRCTECGRVIHEDDANYPYDDDRPYCDDCAPSDSHSIHSYDYKPYPVFHGDPPRYFGVELEVDDAGETTDRADAILVIANRRAENAYCKHDGSLHDGFEIVTHPMSLEYHLTEMPWKEVLHRAIEMGFLSHQAETCGLHIHVSRKALGDTYEEQESTIARILYFFEANWTELLKFSRRTQRQLEQWARRYGYKDEPKKILDSAKSDGWERYRCVNLTNRDTIEFRIFRGTLKLNTLIATLQLVNRILDIAVNSTDEMMKSLSWTTFVSTCTEPELIQYLKERRLYVNDPTESEVEL